MVEAICRAFLAEWEDTFIFCNGNAYCSEVKTSVVLKLIALCCKYCVYEHLKLVLKQRLLQLIKALVSHPNELAFQVVLQPYATCYKA